MLSTLIVYLTKGDEDHGIDVVKEVEGGLNKSSINQLQLHGPYVGDVAKIGLIIAIVGLMVGVNIAYALI